MVGVWDEEKAPERHGFWLSYSDIFFVSSRPAWTWDADGTPQVFDLVDFQISKFCWVWSSAVDSIFLYHTSFVMKFAES
jgi:hypothetical protein